MDVHLLQNHLYTILGKEQEQEARSVKAKLQRYAMSTLSSPQTASPTRVLPGDDMEHPIMLDTDVPSLDAPTFPYGSGAASSKDSKENTFHDPELSALIRRTQHLEERMGIFMTIDDFKKKNDDIA